MNRQEALEWLVENVTEWPVSAFDYSSPIVGWDFWVSMNGDVVFSGFGDWGYWPDEEGSEAEIITKADWLAATDNMTTKMEE